MTDRAIEAVVFDWDGTLVDSKRALLASFQETTREVLGAPFPAEHEDVERILQIRGQEAFEEIAAGDRDLYARIEQVFHRIYVERMEAIEPFPGVLETIAALRAAGLGIGVATSKFRSRLTSKRRERGSASCSTSASAATRSSSPSPTRSRWRRRSAASASIPAPASTSATAPTTSAPPVAPARSPSPSASASTRRRRGPPAPTT